MKRIGILYHPKVKKSEEFTLKLKDFFKGKGIECWSLSSWDESAAREQMDGSDLMISVGGDGTILRVARIIFPRQIPIVGINFGNLGFMTEFEAGDSLEGLAKIIVGKGWTEERAMVQARVKRTRKTYYALNDVVVGRGSRLRLINVEVRVNDQLLTTYRADGVIVSTATGSTGYSLAANGPIMHPEAREMILKAVCPHLSLDKALVLTPDTEVKLQVFTNHEAVVSMDGQVEEPLQDADEVTVTLSKNVSKFTRLRSRDMFYGTLVSKLKGKSL
jgi:NAD+ kinase